MNKKVMKRICMWYALVIAGFFGLIGMSYAGNTAITFTILGSGDVDTGTVDTGGDTETEDPGEDWSWGWGTPWIIRWTDTGYILLGSATGSDGGADLSGQISLYQWAKKYDLVTVPVFNAQAMNVQITKADLAKAIVIFVQNVWWQKIVPNETCNIKKYSDYRAINPSDRYYVKAACDMGLMGWNADRKTLAYTYHPYQMVTRAQLGTIISRMLYGATYDNGSTSKRYQGHLKGLTDKGFLKSTSSPLMIDTRTNMLTILKRIAEAYPKRTPEVYARNTRPGITTGSSFALSGSETDKLYKRSKRQDLMVVPVLDQEALYGQITRADLATLMTLFVHNVRWARIAHNRGCEITRYSDYNAIHPTDRYFIQSACDLGLMGWNGNRTAILKSYNPYARITRDQLSTIFSRFIYGSTYDNNTGTGRYVGHMGAIHKLGLIKMTDPTITENVINVLTILQRIAVGISNGTVKPFGYMKTVWAL